MRAGGLALGAALLVLGGCEQGAEGTGVSRGGDATERATTGRSVQIVERDVEAPEVFQLTDLGLWDGRPSLGGVWIAHAEAEDPERVIIRNDDTGEFVIGALFRRERENPGPRLQVSSDAAAALGMLAGQPVSLNVTALRRQEAPPVAAPEEEAPTALAEADTERQQIAAADMPADAGADAGAETEAEGTTALAAATTEEPPRRRGLAALFGRRSPEPTTAPEAETDASGGIVTTAIESRPIDDITPTAARSDAAGPAQPASGTPVASAPRTVAAPAATAAPAAAPAATAAPVAAPAAPPAPAATAAASGATIDRPFVQIGIFSVEANANRAAGMLRAEGLTPTIRREEHRGQASWRVVAGPAASTAEQTRLMAAVRRLGFEDAYAVRR